MANKNRLRSRDLQGLFDRFIGTDKERLALYEEAIIDFDVAQKLYDLRKQAGMTQAQLAKAVKTSTSVISRLEDADYQGHSLAMLRRIAAALGKRLQVNFVDISPNPASGDNRKRSPKAT